MPPRARRRTIHPGRRTAIAVDELGEDLVAMDIAAYIRPPIANTARLATARVRHPTGLELELKTPTSTLAVFAAAYRAGHG